MLINQTLINIVNPIQYPIHIAQPWIVGREEGQKEGRKEGREGRSKERMGRKGGRKGESKEGVCMLAVVCITVK